MTDPSRTLVHYLVLPRRGDAVKWAILPTGFLVGVLARGLPSGDVVVVAIATWVGLEMLVYQARYQWNDIRGFDADQLHPGGDRGRLPGPLSRKRSHIAWSAATAVIKVVVAVCVCALVSNDAAWTMASLTVAVFALAAVYETLRHASTGRTNVVPPPVTPGLVAIWFTIGAGYALRAVTGLSLAVSLETSTFVGGVATCWLFGIAWITSRWAVESLAFARPGPDRLLWHATKEHAREHQLALVRWLPRWSESTSPKGPERWMATRRATRWSAPWNVAGALGGGCAAFTGVLLVDPKASTNTLILCSVVGFAVNVVLLASGRLREVATLAAGPFVVVIFFVLGAERPILSVVPWWAVAVAQVFYLRQDLATLGHFSRRFTRCSQVHQPASPTGSAA